MDGDRWRQRACPQKPREPFPCPAPTIRSPIEPVPPAALDLTQETTQAVRVPGDPVVPVVPSKLLSELAMLLAYWRMAVPAAPPSDPRDRPTQAICGGLLLDHPVPAPGFRPVVGKAQQIERPPSSGGRGVPRLRVPWLAKVDQSSLLVERRLELPGHVNQNCRLRQGAEAPVQHRASRRRECDEARRGGPCNAARTC